jgi:hypothetical protein
VITLASLGFSGPFLAPFWAPPKTAGLYAVLVPGWKLMTFRALYFGQAEMLDSGLVKTHSRLGEWRTIAGTEWNLYVATHEMSFSTRGQRESAVRELARSYKPGFEPIDEKGMCGTLLLAQAMRQSNDR